MSFPNENDEEHIYVEKTKGKKMQNYQRILMNAFLILLISSCGSIQKEMNQFNIRFLTWGSLPFKKEITGDTTNQKILYAIRKDYKNYSEIADDISVPIDTVIHRMNELAQFDLVAADKNSKEKWVTNVPIYDQNEIRLAEKICLKYAKKEAEIFYHSLKEIQELYSTLTISEYFNWDRISWIIIGALISDFIVIDRIRFFPEYRDEQFLPRLHTDGSRWSLTGYVNFDNIDFKENKWSFYQTYFKDRSAGFSKFGFYRPKENRGKPPKNPLYFALTDIGDILFNINDRALSFENLREVTNIHRDTLKIRIDYLTSLDPPAIILKDGKYVSNIPIFSKNDLKRMLSLGDKIAAKIHTDVIIPCQTELKEKARVIGLRHPLPDGIFVRDIALKHLVDEGILPALPSPPIPWNFGVWGWEGQLYLWEDVI